MTKVTTEWIDKNHLKLDRSGDVVSNVYTITMMLKTGRMIGSGLWRNPLINGL